MNFTPSIPSSSSTNTLRNFQQRSEAYKSQLHEVRQNQPFMKMMRLVFDNCDPLNIAKLIKYSSFGGVMSSISLEDCCRSIPGLADEIKQFAGNFLEKPLFSSDFYLKGCEAELLLKICNFGITENDGLTVAKIKELESTLFKDTEPGSTPETLTGVQTKDGLHLNDTRVIKLSKTVGAQQGMFVCAPLHANGTDELRNCYQTIFRTAVDNKAKTLLVPTFSTGANGYSHDEAADIAIKEACDFLQSQPDLDIHIVFVVYQNEDKTKFDQPNADAYKKALDRLGSSVDAESKRLSCVKSQIQYLSADMVVIPVGTNFQTTGAVYQAIESASKQTKLCTAVTTYISLNSPKTDEKNRSVYPVFASTLFSQTPIQWGLRGDPFLWKALKASLEATYLPKDGAQLQELIAAKAKELTGHELGTNFYSEDFGQEGMTAGQVSGKFWRKKAIPLLLEKFKEIQQEQLLLAQKTSVLLAGQMDSASTFSSLPKEIAFIIGEKFTEVSSSATGK